MPSLGFPTPLGSCAISWQEDRLVGFNLPPCEETDDETPQWVREIVDRVQAHLRGDFQDFDDLPYAWETVSPFQQKIYKAALLVKSGQTQTYGGLCAAAGFPLSSARAVGMALGQNPWSLLVPCHRFVGADGRMVGFSSPGGIQTKLRLLALEGSQLFAE